MIPRTVLRFGEELRRERLVREITLEEISASTKISVRLLKALEDSDISRLPAPAFTRGFIRSYAIHIGIDPEEKVCAYLTDLAEASSGISPSVARVRPRFWRGRGATAGTIVGGVTLVLLLLGLIARPERRPAARPDKPAARAGRVAGGVGGVQDRVGPLHRPDQDGVDQVGTGLEVAVEGDPADAGGRGDAGDAHLGIARQALRGRVEDRGDVAAGVGPLGPRSRHRRNPFS